MTNVLLVIVMLAAALLFGAYVNRQVARAARRDDELLRGFARDVAVCDEAENGWSL